MLKDKARRCLTVKKELGHANSFLPTQPLISRWARYTWYRMPPSKLFEALHARDAKRVKHLVSKEGCDVNETGAVRSLTPPLPSR